MQELIASKRKAFVKPDWTILGYAKGTWQGTASPDNEEGVKDLTSDVSARTKIPEIYIRASPCEMLA